MKAAFQGELGAFSQQAIRQILGPKAKPVPCQRFDQVFAALKARTVDCAVVPIENTLHGSVYENYDLLLKYDFAICAETSVRIIHNLIAPDGVSFRAGAQGLLPSRGPEPMPGLLHPLPASGT